MKPSARIVVADSSPLIALARLGLLEVLPELFENVLVPQTVLTECTALESYPETAPILGAVADGHLVVAEELAAIPSWNLDPGETSAIAIALEREAGVIMDDQAGRRVAQYLGLPVIGTAGILVLAKRSGLLSAVKPSLDALADSGYFLSPQLRESVLRLVGED